MISLPFIQLQRALQMEQLKIWNQANEQVQIWVIIAVLRLLQKSCADFLLLKTKPFIDLSYSFTIATMLLSYLSICNNFNSCKYFNTPGSDQPNSSLGLQADVILYSSLSYDGYINSWSVFKEKQACFWIQKMRLNQITDQMMMLSCYMCR